jgi:hypothetical protein
VRPYLKRQNNKKDTYKGKWTELGRTDRKVELPGAVSSGFPYLWVCHSTHAKDTLPPGYSELDRSHFCSILLTDSLSSGAPQ